MYKNEILIKIDQNWLKIKNWYNKFWNEKNYLKIQKKLKLINFYNLLKNK